MAAMATTATGRKDRERRARARFPLLRSCFAFLRFCVLERVVSVRGPCERIDRSTRLSACCAAAKGLGFLIPSTIAARRRRGSKKLSPHEFVRAYAAHLKRSGKIEVPSWVDIVKTATFKELAPYDPDWYYVRTASMARKIYLRGGIGVGAFRKIYGGRKSNGSRPSHFGKSSGSIARDVLKQLEKIDIIEKDPRGGRKITSNGQRDLDQVAGRIAVPAA